MKKKKKKITKSELLAALKYIIPKFSPDTMSEVEEKKRIQQLCK